MARVLLAAGLGGRGASDGFYWHGMGWREARRVGDVWCGAGRAEWVHRGACILYRGACGMSLTESGWVVWWICRCQWMGRSQVDVRGWWYEVLRPVSTHACSCGPAAGGAGVGRGSRVV